MIPVDTLVLKALAPAVCTSKVHTFLGQEMRVQYVHVASKGGIGIADRLAMAMTRAAGTVYMLIKSSPNFTPGTELEVANLLRRFVQLKFQPPKV